MMSDHIRAAGLVLILALALPAADSQGAGRRSCERACKRFTRQCMETTAQPRRCQRLLRRLDKCSARGVACAATRSTTTTTIPASGAAVVVDDARAATMTLPLDGGTLTTTGADGTVYSLTIPPGALLLETAITMTPIVSLAGEALPVLGVDLKPSGLRLYEFAELRIVPSQLAPTADVAGFSYEGDGDDLHAYPAALDAGSIVLHVIHFSGAGAKICVELCPPPIVPPPPAITESQLEQLIAELDPSHPLYASRLAELLHAYYDLFIAPDLPLMQQDCQLATSRIPKVLAWSRTNQLLLNEEGFEGKNQTVGNALVGSAANCWSEATAACLDPRNAYQVQNVLQIARQAQLLGGDPVVFDPSTVRRCSGRWSGTITHEWRLEEDAAYEDDTRRGRALRKQQWQILPEGVGVPCDGCSSQMYRAVWSASGTVDDVYVYESQTCATTVTAATRVEGGGPSAVVMNYSRSRDTFSIQRGSVDRGAPPRGKLEQPYVMKLATCRGYESTTPVTLYVWETWGWPFPDGVPLGRTDPTITTTAVGQKVDRQERAVTGGTEVVTDTWTWNLTMEPDAAP